MLKDRYDRKLNYLRLSVTDRCNLRCTYCMPEKGIPMIRPDEIMTKQEILTLARAFLELGVTKVRLTGGEPTLRGDLSEIIRELKAMGAEQVVLTTNGILLRDKAKEYKEAGLDRVNISLDTLDAAKYREITRGGELSDALAGIEAALAEGLTPVKLNVVLMRGFNDVEADDFIELTRNPAIHVRFIELMPIGQAEGKQAQFMPVSEIIERYPDFIELQSYDHSVARRFQKPGYPGIVGFINPVSCNFCSDCNRIRVSASGRLRLCLHAGEVGNLKSFLHDPDQLKQEILRLVDQKPQSHHLDLKSDAGTNMNEIGG